MKLSHYLSARVIRAFALKELLVIVAVGAALLCVVVVELARARHRARGICCNCNLKQVGLGFKVWAGDHQEKFPMQVSTTNGGTMELVDSGNTFIHFAALSNELSTPKVLVCPADTRVAAKDFEPRFSNTNLSYFVGVDASDSLLSQMFLSGDHNITNGVPKTDGILLLTTNSVAGWTHEMHMGKGNVALADGSVQQFTTSRLREAIKWSGVATNRLAMP